jgi:hypothetical protein
MRAFNRLVAILFLLFTIVTALVVLAVPERVIALLLLSLQNAERDMPQFAENPQQWWMFLLFRAVIAILVIVIAGALLWLEVRRPKAKTVKVHKADGAEVVIDAGAIARSLQFHLDKLPDVIRVKPVIAGRRGGVDVQLHLETSPEIDVPAKAEEVKQVVLQVVEGQMGLKLSSSPKIKIDYAPYPRSDEAFQKRVAAKPEPSYQQDDSSSFYPSPAPIVDEESADEGEAPEESIDM